MDVWLWQKFFDNKEALKFLNALKIYPLKLPLERGRGRLPRPVRQPLRPSLRQDPVRSDQVGISLAVHGERHSGQKEGTYTSDSSVSLKIISSSFFCSVVHQGHLDGRQAL